jgi:hypothetical protein
MINTLEKQGKIENLVTQRPELQYAGFLQTRQGLIVAAQIHQRLKVFKENGDYFECIQEFDHIIIDQGFRMIDLQKEDALIVSFTGRILWIPFVIGLKKYDQRLIEKLLRPHFNVTQLIELDDGTVIASFGNYEHGISYPMEIIYGPRNDTKINRSV